MVMHLGENLEAVADVWIQTKALATLIGPGFLGSDAPGR